MIKIEISGGSAEEISTHISSLANLMSGTAVPAIAAATTAPATPTEAKPTSRRRKSDPAPEAATEAVQETPTVSEETVVETSEPVVEAAEEPQVEETVTEAPADEPVSENLELFKTFDTAAARNWVIANYLNKYFNDPATRTAKFKDIVSHFDYPSLSAVPVEKLVDVLLFVEAKIAEVEK